MTTDLIQRLRTAWTYCGVEQALRFEAAAALEQQAAQIEVLRSDAERYRWLRDNGHDAIGRDRGAGPEWTYGDELDALIDAALRQEQPT